MSRRSLPPAALAPLFLVLLAGTLPAQVITASLYGAVIDSSGSAVPNAAVSVVSAETGAKLRTVTDTAGEFTLAGLQPGTYTLTVEANGFNLYRQTGLALAGGDRLRQTYTLEVGSLSQTVEVTAATPLVNTATAEQRLNIESMQVRELPTSRRDWTSLLNLNTGINTGGGTVSMNGLAGASFRITVDGTDSTSDSEFPSMAMYQNFNFVKAVSLEAIEEVNVAKGIASAEIANTMSGNVNINTKRGTNELHGSLFALNQTENLNARNQFLRTKPGAVFNQFGGSLGGPIIKNKVFAFGVYEGYRLRGFQPLAGNVPTAEFRARAVAAVPAYKPFLDMFPLPNTPTAPGASVGFFQGAGSEVGGENHAVFRGDYILRDNLMLSGRYTRSRPVRRIPRVAEQNWRRWSGVSEVGTANVIWSRPSFTSESRIGFNDNTVNRLDNIYALGIPGITGGLGFDAAGETYFKEGLTGTGEEIVRVTRGRHSISFGGIFGQLRFGRDNIETPEVTYSNEADFLNNLPSRVQVTWGLKSFWARNTFLGFFVQDDFKVSRRLTLNMGLRWDYFGLPSERDGRIFNRDEPFGFGPWRPPDRAWERDFRNFGPRLGLAWQLDEGGATVLRAGAGLFQSPRTPFGSSVDLIANAIDEPVRVIYSRADVLQYPNLLRYPVVNERVLPIARGSQALISSLALNPYSDNPFSYQYTLSLARQIARDFAIETAYVGTKGMRLATVRMMNQPDRQTGVRPVAGFATFRYRDDAAFSSFHSWQTTLRKRFSRSFSGNVYYTFARAMALTGDGDIQLPDPPQNTWDLFADYGPINNDVRHRFASDFLWEVPLARFGGGGALSRLALRGWQVSGIFNAQTGAPVNVVQPSGLDMSRPDYVGGNPYRSNATATLSYLDPAAFARVPIVAASGLPARPGNLGRNALRGIGFWNLDLTLAKGLHLTERYRLQLRGELLNALNHTNLSGLNANITAGAFGRFTSTRGARTVQVGARFSF